MERAKVLRLRSAVRCSAQDDRAKRSRRSKYARPQIRGSCGRNSRFCTSIPRSNELSCQSRASRGKNLRFCAGVPRSGANSCRPRASRGGNLRLCTLVPRSNANSCRPRASCGKKSRLCIPDTVQRRAFSARAFTARRAWLRPWPGRWRFRQPIHPPEATKRALSDDSAYLKICLFPQRPRPGKPAATTLLKPRLRAVVPRGAHCAQVLGTIEHREHEPHVKKARTQNMHGAILRYPAARLAARRLAGSWRPAGAAAGNRSSRRVLPRGSPLL